MLRGPHVGNHKHVGQDLGCMNVWRGNWVMDSEHLGV